jgi:hypothetical protein
MRPSIYMVQKGGTPMTNEANKKTSKHTPRSWRKFYQKGMAAPVVLDQDDEHIATVYGNPADARLIAAAPELLEALRGLAETYERTGGSLVDERRYRMARALLARVDGGES